MPAAIHGRFRVNHGGEEFGLHEPIDPLERLAFPAIAVAWAALVIQQHFQIVSQFVHDLELIVGSTGLAINYI